MKPEQHFSRQPKSFWANVRTISEQVGYTIRGEGLVKIPSLTDIKKAYEILKLDVSQLIDKDKFTETGQILNEYFHYRADVLNNYVEPRLMDVERAKKEYEELLHEKTSDCPIPMNKQKGDKKAPAYLTAIINILIDTNLEGFSCNYDPRQLTAIVREGFPVRTFARRIDGAFPSIVNPIAIWEIKEYYYTTTFGSRVADGVYETLLDGMEIEELREHEGINVLYITL